MSEKKIPYACELVAEIASCMYMWLWLMAIMTIVMLIVYKGVHNFVFYGVMIVPGCARMW